MRVDTDLRVGTELAGYRIEALIGRGGMGVVYRARDVRLNRDVALKVLPPDLVADPARRSRFVQEAQAASSLEHPHIAVIHEIDEVDGVRDGPVEVAERLDGDDASASCGGGHGVHPSRGVGGGRGVDRCPGVA